jgi:hypothetical protein
MKKIKVGSKVRIVKNTSASINPVGSVGIVSEDKRGEGNVFRVIVEGISDGDLANASLACELELLRPIKFKVGSTVRVVKNSTCSRNPIDSIGTISELRSCGEVCRVIVPGITDDDFANNSRFDDLELVITKQEKIAKLLKKISKLNKA